VLRLLHHMNTRLPVLFRKCAVGVTGNVPPRSRPIWCPNRPTPPPPPPPPPLPKALAPLPPLSRLHHSSLVERGGVGGAELLACVCTSVKRDPLLQRKKPTRSITWPLVLDSTKIQEGGGNTGVVSRLKAELDQTVAYAVNTLATH